MYKSSNISLFLNAANLQNLLSKKANKPWSLAKGLGLGGGVGGLGALPVNNTITTRHKAKSPMMDYINQPGATPVSKLTPDALAGLTGNVDISKSRNKNPNIDRWDMDFGEVVKELAHSALEPGQPTEVLGKDLEQTQKINNDYIKQRKILNTLGYGLPNPGHMAPLKY